MRRRRRRSGLSATPLFPGRATALCVAPLFNDLRTTGLVMAFTNGAGRKFFVEMARKSRDSRGRGRRRRTAGAHRHQNCSRAPPEKPCPRAQRQRLLEAGHDHVRARGLFSLDNFVSNETSYQWGFRVSDHRDGGVYLGVGPDRNFTISSRCHKIAFILDIRRQNILTHLMYRPSRAVHGPRRLPLTLFLARPRPPH
jgi:hypothetical protein